MEDKEKSRMMLSRETREGLRITGKQGKGYVSLGNKGRATYHWETREGLRITGKQGKDYVSLVRIMNLLF